VKGDIKGIPARATAAKLYVRSPAVPVTLPFFNDFSCFSADGSRNLNDIFIAFFVIFKSILSHPLSYTFSRDPLEFKQS